MKRLMLGQPNRKILKWLGIAAGTLAIFWGFGFYPGSAETNTSPGAKPKKVGLIDFVPPGTVITYAGIKNPEGYLECNGDEIDINTYEDLYKAIQNLYGLANPGKFRLPDLRSRVVVGVGKGSGFDDGQRPLTMRSLGDRWGEERHQLTKDELAKHDHQYSQRPHGHGLVTKVVGGSGGSLGGILDQYVKDGAQGRGTWNTYVHEYENKADITFESDGKDVPHNIMQPSIALRYFIKY